ncbi:serine hydrolase [Roseiconus nitratireducens]|nr:serine hydrolase [Roseiconus nitratireducens]
MNNFLRPLSHRRARWLLVLFLIVSWQGRVLPAAPAVRNVEGWTVRIDPELLADMPMAERCLKALANHLQRVTYILPDSKVEQLRDFPIWIDRHNERLGAMQYHPSEDWLRNNGHDPALAKHIHIPRAADLLDRRTWEKHPYCILHELAHAYHDQVLGFDDPEIMQLFDQAKARGGYEDVLLFDGRNVPHYALTNHKEYFAESTEAFLGVNDFYPFVRAELQKHDPRMHAHLVKLWSDPALPTESAETREQSVDQLLRDAITDGQMAGAVVMMSRKDKVIFSTAVGDAQTVPVRRPMRPDTVFDLASLTKPVATATSIMCLVDRGLVDLDAPVANYLPEFATNGKESITVKDLLLHRGGLIADNSLSDYVPDAQQAWENLCKTKPLADPGQRFIYSDVGFIVLGKLVEKVSGQPLQQFADEQIFEPLGMQETGYLPEESLRDRAATTEEVDGRWLTGKVHDPRSARMGGVAGHAGLFSTAEDLLRYGQAMCHQGQWEGTRVFSVQTYRTMVAPRDVPRGQRALGWDVESPYSSNRPQQFSQTAFGHGGFTGTVLWIDPQQDLVFVFLSNRLHPDGKGSVNRLAAKVADAILQNDSADK